MNEPIGIFDSGIGGLTVVKQLTKLLPNENYIYFGDTARVPYGTRSNRLIKQYAFEDTAFLQQFNIKLLVVACNSVSAVAVDLLESAVDIPITGVIMPGVEAAIQKTKNLKIGVIGTTATVASGAYEQRIKAINPDITVFGQACPMLVHLVEEGWVNEEITRLTIIKYLKPLLEKSIDTIILGCTHFPVVSDLIKEVVGPSITLIDSGKETAKKVKQILDKSGLNKNDPSAGEFNFYVSDIPDKFDEVGTLFLGRPVVQATHVDFDNFLMEQGEKIYEPLRRNS
jgi:glutamate racemase